MSGEAPSPDGGGETRSRVLATLQDAGQPMDAAEVADVVGLHVNTARFHLDRLVESGLTDREPERRERPGRPRTLYRARPGGTPAGTRRYELLAEILASFVATQVPQPARAAQAAGREWGRFLTDRPRPYENTDAATATRHLVSSLDELGFAPEARTTGGSRQILLRHCPFREAAGHHQEVVCGIHLGLMRGMLEELDAPLETERLDPFVEPDLCIAHLEGRSGPATTG
ncbi:MAG: helix-turn-helix transcriptional regulator [Marmoricola sp.]